MDIYIQILTSKEDVHAHNFLRPVFEKHFQMYVSFSMWNKTQEVQYLRSVTSCASSVMAACSALISPGCYFALSFDPGRAFEDHVLFYFPQPR